MKRIIIPLITSLIFVLLTVGCNDCSNHHGTDTGNAVDHPADVETENNVDNHGNSPVNSESTDTEESIVESDVPTNVEILAPETDAPSDEIPVDPSKLNYSTEYGELIYLDSNKVYTKSKGVTVNGTTVVISKAGSYFISGELTDGKIVVNAGKNDVVNITFGTTKITSSTSAPLYLLKADMVNLTILENSSLTLTNGGKFVQSDDNNIDGVLFSKVDLQIKATNARLYLNSPSGNGIVAKDTLVLDGGYHYCVVSDHGLDVNDNITVSGCTLNITSGKDGIHVENNNDTSLGNIIISSGNISISSDGDGISASGTVNIKGGNFTLLTGGGHENGKQHSSGGFGMGGRPGGQGGHNNRNQQTSDSDISAKGIKSSGNMTVSGGTFIIDSADDAVHSNASIEISSGKFEISSGDDGFHADDTLSLSSAEIIINNCYEGLEALHVKVSSGNISLTATDDGINAAGGTDESGYGGDRGGDRFGGMHGGRNSNGSVTISGGNLYINAYGDGIDANGTLEISGGYTMVCGPSSGDTTVLDYDKTGVITGGTFIGSGGSMMAQTFSSSMQGVIAVSVGNQQASAKIIIVDSAGNTVIEYTPELDFSIVILSDPKIISGESYTLYVGDLSGNITAQ